MSSTLNSTRFLIYPGIARQISFLNGQRNFSDWVELELDGDVDIKITYNIADIKEPNKRKTDFSRTISIPGTKKNNETLGELWEIGIDSTYNTNYKKNCVIIQNGVEIFDGIMEINKIIHGEYRDDIRYEITIYGKLGDLFNRLADITVDQLDFSEYNHTYNLTTVRNSWGPRDSSNSGYIFKNGSQYQNFNVGLIILQAVTARHSDDRLKLNVYTPHNLSVGDFIHIEGDAGLSPVTNPVSNGSTANDWNKHWLGSSMVIKVIDAQTIIVDKPYFARWNASIAGGNNTVNPFNVKFFKVESTGEGYIYPMINYNKSANWIYDWRLQNGIVDNWTPAVYVKTLVDKIFNYAGLQYESDFFNSEYFKRLIVPHNKHSMSLNKNKLIENSFLVGSTSNQIGTFLCEYKPLTYSYADDLNFFIPNGNINKLWEILEDFSATGVFIKDIDVLDDNWLTLNTTPSAKFKLEKDTGQHRAKKTIDLLFNNDNLPPNIDISDVYNTINNTINVKKTQTYNLKYNFDFAMCLEDIVDREELYTIRFAGKPLTSRINKEHQAVKLNLIDLSTGNIVKQNIIKINDYIGKVGSRNSSTQYDLNTVNFNGNFNVQLKSDRPYRFQLELDYRTWILNSFDNVGDTSSYNVEYLITNQSLELINPNTTVNFGDNVDLSYFVPNEVKCSDMLLDLINIFNLYIAPSKGNPDKLIIEPRDIFYNNDFTDWTLKLDTSKELEIIPLGLLDNKKYLYSYKEDQDSLNERYKTRFNEIYGEYDIEIDNDFIKNTLEKKNKVFSPTTLHDADNTNVIAHQLTLSTIYQDNGGVMINENDKRSWNYRLLFYPGLIYTSNTIVLESLPTPPYPAIVQTILYPYAGHLDNPLDPHYDLNFDLTNDVYYKGYKYTTNNIYNMFHRNELLNISNKNSKIITGYFYLNQNDINNINFRHTYIVDRYHLLLNKITDYSGLNVGVIKCEFITKSDTLIDDIYNTSITGSSNRFNELLIKTVG